MHGIENKLVTRNISFGTCMCNSICCCFVSGYNNGMTVHNGVHHDPDKLKRLEIERLELGLCHFYLFYWCMLILTVTVGCSLEQRSAFSQLSQNAPITAVENQPITAEHSAL